MVFVRKKTVYGNDYYSLVKSVKRKQKEFYLGKTIPLDLFPLYKKRKKR